MREFINVVIPPLLKPFTYLLPTELERTIEVGYQVEVSFGHRTATGYVVSRGQNSSAALSTFEIKPVHSSSQNRPMFLPQQLKLFQWIAEYYAESLASVIDVAIPPCVPVQHLRFASLHPEIDTASSMRGPLERQIVATLRDNGAPYDVSLLSKRFRGAKAALKRLAARGIVLVSEHEILDSHLKSGHAGADWARRSVNLNVAQTHALSVINKSVEERQFKPFLLHGVTGSGKTEVYIEAIQHTLALGLGALIIVPEIALTPQLIDRFQVRLKSPIGVLHSALHKRARWDAWRALLENRCAFALGARSGVFAPVHKLGLIIVDEEHDSSYKQSEGVRYNARDVAIVRAKLDGCPVLLGSATPSLESYYHARTKRYAYLSLPSRAGISSTAQARIIDLNRLKPWQMASKTISQELYAALQEVLARDEQAFILYNRRGFASYLQCERCDAVVPCPNCSVTLTYHQRSHSLICHYCGIRSVPPTHCHCVSDSHDKQPSLVQRGAGTERVFDELVSLFPAVAIDRLDRDVAQEVSSYRIILDKVRSGATKILVGTQMIAKGHDLPNVTLVGVVDCDIGLHMPDFRAGERVFQLLTQAAGRSGRGDKAGLVLLQTRVPNNASLRFTITNDYHGFALHELKARESLGYPPFTRMLRIIASSTEKSEPQQVLDQTKEFIDQYRARVYVEVELLGPAPAPLQRLKTHWRWHLLLKCNSTSYLTKLARAIKAELKWKKTVRMVFDLDPQEVM